MHVIRRRGWEIPESRATPEHLFAAGYAACFGSACEFMSRQLKLIPKSLTVHSTTWMVSARDGPHGPFKSGRD
jgi:organic hydroperoxide reductase OsmC/OhrA